MGMRLSPIKKVLIAVGVLIALFAVFVAMQPSEFRIERSIAIAAEPGSIFPLVNDLQRSTAWSPWEKLDPAIKRSFAGPASGVGAIYSWEGNDAVGAGRLTIVESEPNARVKTRLENFRPFESTSTLEVVLTAQGGTTRVQWSLSGPMKFVEKAVCLFVSMEKILGPKFEEGLGMLKGLAEAR